LSFLNKGQFSNKKKQWTSKAKSIHNQQVTADNKEISKKILKIYVSLVTFFFLRLLTTTNGRNALNVIIRESTIYKGKLRSEEIDSCS